MLFTAILFAFVSGFCSLAVATPVTLCLFVGLGLSFKGLTPKGFVGLFEALVVLLGLAVLVFKGVATGFFGLMSSFFGEGGAKMSR